MISDNGDDKKTQKSRSVPALSSPAAIREHIPSEVSVSHFPTDLKHESRILGGKYHQIPIQDEIISGTDTSSSEVGKSPCFVLPKKRRKSNRDNFWPVYEQETGEMVKQNVDLSCKSSLHVRSSGFFFPNWSAAGEEYVDDVETSSEMRDDNDFSQDEDVKTELEDEERVKDEESTLKNEENVKRDADENATPTFDENFQRFMMACEDELLENETFPTRLWGSDTDEHGGVMSSSHKTSECLEGSKASLDVGGLSFVEDDVESQLANAADDVVHDVIKEESQVVYKSCKSKSQLCLSEINHLQTVICSHMKVDNEFDGFGVVEEETREVFDIEQVEKEMKMCENEKMADDSASKCSQENILTPSEECMMEMCEREDEKVIVKAKSKSKTEINPEEIVNESVFNAKSVLTISLEKLQLERKRTGSQVNNAYVDKIDAFENYVDSDNTISPLKDEFMVERASQMSPCQQEKLLQSSPDGVNLTSASASTTCETPDDKEVTTPQLTKPLYIFRNEKDKLNNGMLMCDDVRLLKQKRQIRPHSASTNRDSGQENNPTWPHHHHQQQQHVEFLKTRAKNTHHRYFIMDNPCSEVRSDDCLSSASVISPSGVSENVEVESPSWSNESVNKYREFAKMRKRELLARFVAERKHREELDQLLAQLHDSYDKLLAKHAEAENTIDQLRLGKPMKIDGLRMSPSVHIGEGQLMMAGEFRQKMRSPFVMTPRGMSSSSTGMMKEGEKSIGMMVEMVNQSQVQISGVHPSRRVADGYCQTDFCPESGNEPFCSSVASFLLRANCLLEQVNSLHECVIEGINLEPNVALQMLSYLWESYLSLQHDVQAHVGHTAALEKIALEDVRNLLDKIHGQLVAIETHHANATWKGLVPLVDKRFEQKNTFSFLRESSSYGSLPASPSASSNSQLTEIRDNFSILEDESACPSVEKGELHTLISKSTNPEPEPDTTQPQHEGSDYFSTTLDKVESKSSNESECIEVVKTLLRAIHSEEIQSSMKKRDVSTKSTITSLSDVNPFDSSLFEVREEEISTFDVKINEVDDVTYTSQNESDVKSENEVKKVGRVVDVDVDVERMETLSLLATLDVEQRRILEDTLRILSEKSKKNDVVVAIDVCDDEIVTYDEKEVVNVIENEICDVGTSPQCEKELDQFFDDAKMTCDDESVIKRDVVMKLLEEVKRRLSSSFERENSAEESSENFSHVMTRQSPLIEKDDEFQWREGEKNVDVTLPEEKNVTSELTESSEFSTESFSEVNSDSAVFAQKERRHDNKHTTYVYVTGDGEDKNGRVVLEKLAEEIQQLRYELLEKRLNGDETTGNKFCTQSCQTEVVDECDVTENGGKSEKVTETLPAISTEQPTVRTNNGDSILHCCGVHHLIRHRRKSGDDGDPKSHQVSLDFDNVDNIPRCPYCQQPLYQIEDVKIPTTSSTSVSSEPIPVSETTPQPPMTSDVTFDDAANDQEEYLKKCDSFTESESTNVDSSGVITTVCACADDNRDFDKDELSQVREVFFAMVEGYGGTKECFASVETTSNTIMAAATIESLSSHEGSTKQIYPMMIMDEDKGREFWENSWYEYSGCTQTEPGAESVPKSFPDFGKFGTRCDSGSPPVSDERSWSSHHWLKSLCEQRLLPVGMISANIEEVEIKEVEPEQEEQEVVLTAPKSSLSLICETASSGSAMNQVHQEEEEEDGEEAVTENSPEIQKLNLNDDIDSAVMCSVSDEFSMNDTPDVLLSDRSNIQTPITTETSLPTETSSMNLNNPITFQTITSSSYQQETPVIVRRYSPVIDEELISELSTSRDRQNDDECTLQEDSAPVRLECPEVVIEEHIEEVPEEVVVIPNNSIGVQVEPSQQDVDIQARPSLRDIDTQMTISVDSSQETDVDGVSLNSKDQTDQEGERSDKSKISTQSLTLDLKKDNNDSTETDEIVVDKEKKELVKMQMVSDSEVPKIKRHRKLGKRSISHSGSSLSSQNEDHQSCKGCARLLRKTEALATTMLKELKGHPLVRESSDENVEMKKLQLIHALDLANKIAKRLKHHSVQMLHSLNPSTEFMS